MSQEDKAYFSKYLTIIVIASHNNSRSKEDVPSNEIREIQFDINMKRKRILMENNTN